jgi:hypothetical protein
MSVDGLIRLILDETDYMDHLQRTQPDYEARQQNVEELVSWY